MLLTKLPPEYTFVGIVSTGGDDTVYQILRTGTQETSFCTVLCFDEEHKKEYTEILALIPIYKALDHRGILPYRIIDADPASLRVLFIYEAFNLTIAALNTLMEKHKKWYCEEALWQVAAQLLDTIEYYNLPRNRQFGSKSTFLTNAAFPHCILRPSLISVTSSFVEETDFLKALSTPAQVAMFPLTVKVLPGVLTYGQLCQHKTRSTEASLAYMAPELMERIEHIQGRDPEFIHNSDTVQPSSAVDMWSIGAILYEMAAQKRYTSKSNDFLALGRYSFEFQTMVKAMLAMESAERLLFKQIMMTERIHKTLAELFNSTKSRRFKTSNISKTPPDASDSGLTSPMDVQARTIIEKLQCSTVMQAQLVSEWQRDLPSEPNYLLGVVNTINEANSAPHVPTGNRFLHTTTHTPRKGGSFAMASPAVNKSKQKIACPRKVGKLAAGTQENHTQLMKQVLRNNLAKAKGEMSQVAITLTDGTSALMLAAENNYIDLARLLLPYECCLQMKDGTTALIIAAKHGHADMAALLLDSEAMIVDNRGYSALLYAVENSHLDCAKVLIKAEANHCAPNGTTAGSLVMQGIERTMQHFTLFRQRLSSTTNTPLQTAQSLTTRVLEKSGKDSRNANGRSKSNIGSKKSSRVEEATAEQQARAEDERVIAKLNMAQLITLHEDPRTPGTYCTCLMIAAKQHSTDLIKIFIHQAGRQTPTGLTALHIAAQVLFFEGVTLLAPLESRYTTIYSSEGFSFYRATALCIAALTRRSMTRSSGKAQSMLGPARWGGPLGEHVRSSSQCSLGRYSSTKISSQNWSRDSEQALISVFNDLIPYEATYQEPRTGKTALIAAAVAGNVAAVQALAELEAGYKMLKGWTAMMCCVYGASTSETRNICDYVECINILLPYEQGIMSECGWSALVYASAYLNTACVEILAPVEAHMSGDTALSFIGALVAKTDMSANERQYLVSQIRSLIVKHRAEDVCGPTQQNVHAASDISLEDLIDEKDMRRYINNKSGLLEDSTNISILEGKYFRWEGPESPISTANNQHRRARASSGLYTARTVPANQERRSPAYLGDSRSSVCDQESFQCQVSIRDKEPLQDYRYRFNSNPLPPLYTCVPSPTGPESALPPINRHKVLTP